MAYSIEAIKAALDSKNKGGDGPKLTYWKAAIGEHEVRFLPYEDSNKQPFQEVLYYDKLSERRIVAPCGFGEPDPVRDLFEIKRKEGKEGWAIAKLMRPKERYYAVLVVRGEEDKGVQVWEFNKEVRDKIYGILSHKDNVDEDYFSTEVGYDFTVKVVQKTVEGKPQTFNGFPMKDFVITPRKKPSKLSTKPAQLQQWLTAMPKLEEIFKGQVKTPEEILVVLQNFAAGLANKPSATPTDSPNAKDTGTEHMGSVMAPASAETDAKLKNAFGDLQ